MSDHKTTNLSDSNLAGNLPGNQNVSQKTRIRIAPWEAADFKTKELGEIRTETGLELETHKDKLDDSPQSVELSRAHAKVARREVTRTRDELNNEGCTCFGFPRRRSSENRR